MYQVRMMEQSAEAQQDALGILGVNLIHGAYTHWRHPHKLLASLKENLFEERLRINIDLVSMSGVSWDHVDERSLNMHLLELGLTPAIMFNSKGVPVLASETLYKKSALIVRGQFRPVSNYTVHFIDSGLKAFLARHQDELDESQVVAGPVESSTRLDASSCMLPCVEHIWCFGDVQRYYNSVQGWFWVTVGGTFSEEEPLVCRVPLELVMADLLFVPGLKRNFVVIWVLPTMFLQNFRRLESPVLSEPSAGCCSAASPSGIPMIGWKQKDVLPPRPQPAHQTFDGVISVMPNGPLCRSSRSRRSAPRQCSTTNSNWTRLAPAACARSTCQTCWAAWNASKPSAATLW